MRQYTVALDTETKLITAEDKAPPLVCMSAAIQKDQAPLPVEAHLATIADQGNILEATFEWILDNAHTIIGQNIAYDMAVLSRAFPRLIPHIFDAYQAGRVFDTMLAEMLHEIGTEGVAVNRPLAKLAEQYLGEEVDKGADTWRLRYGELIDTPLAQWPAEAQAYARRDALLPLQIATKQRANNHMNLHDMPRQAAAAFSLQLMGVWGFRVDTDRAGEFFNKLATQLPALDLACEEAGIKRRVKGKLVKSMDVIRKIVECSLGDAAKTTPKLKTSTDREQLQAAIATGKAPALESLIQFDKAKKLLDLQKNFSSSTCHASFNPLVSTGRTSCRNPNLQNLPRGDEVRSLFIPRDGYVLASCDYKVAELVSLAQACLSQFGISTMADIINAGEDPHTFFAEYIGGDRLIAKIANFGYAGGMGAESFMEYAKGYGVDVTGRDAKQVKARWLRAYPEMKIYFREINNCIELDGELTLTDGSRRTRGAVSYTQACNYLFQGLTADGTKDALFQIATACYADSTSILYGCRPVNFVHDEVIVEVPEATAHECALEIKRVMIEAMQLITPDVKVDADVCLMRRWDKKAEAQFDDGGRLIPYEAA